MTYTLKTTTKKYKKKECKGVFVLPAADIDPLHSDICTAQAVCVCRLQSGSPVVKIPLIFVQSDEQIVAPISNEESSFIVFFSFFFFFQSMQQQVHPVTPF